MTSQEKIIEEYKEYWELFSIEEQEAILKNNGWVSKFNHPLHWEMQKFYEIETVAYGVGTSWRPKSLNGIENNNGWIKIESEDDLPITDGKTIQYFFVTKSGNITENGYCDLMKNKRIQYSLVYTHYQQIIKPEKPLY